MLFRLINTDKQNLVKKMEDVENKIPNVSGLVTSATPNTKLVKLRVEFLTIVKNVKIDIKISKTEGKYYTTSD